MKGFISARELSGKSNTKVVTEPKFKPGDTVICKRDNERYMIHRVMRCRDNGEYIYGYGPADRPEVIYRGVLRESVLRRA